MERSRITSVEHTKELISLFSLRMRIIFEIYYNPDNQELNAKLIALHSLLTNFLLEADEDTKSKGIYVQAARIYEAINIIFEMMNSKSSKYS